MCIDTCIYTSLCIYSIVCMYHHIHQHLTDIPCVGFLTSEMWSRSKVPACRPAGLRRYPATPIGDCLIVSLHVCICVRVSVCVCVCVCVCLCMCAQW